MVYRGLSVGHRVADKARMVIWSQAAGNGEPPSNCEPRGLQTELCLRKSHLVSVCNFTADPGSLEILSLLCAGWGPALTELSFISSTCPSAQWVLFLALFYGQETEV